MVLGLAAVAGAASAAPELVLSEATAAACDELTDGLVASCEVQRELPSARRCPDYKISSHTLHRTNTVLYEREEIAVTAGGEINLEGCPAVSGSGHVAEGPDIRLEYQDENEGRDLVFHVIGDCDTVVLVNDKFGNWHFSDDFRNGSDEPVVQIQNAPSGTYDIWVGTYGASNCNSRLRIETWNAFANFVEDFEEAVGTGSSRQAGYEYKFTNNCRHPVRLAIHYRIMNGDWKSDGWWEFDAFETAFLADNGRRIRSSNSIWYYYAECSGGRRCEWSGDTNLRFDGRTLPMRKKSDDEGVNEWAIRCSD